MLVKNTGRKGSRNLHFFFFCNSCYAEFCLCLGLNHVFQNIKKQDLGQMADKLKTRSIELNDEVKPLSNNLNDSKHTSGEQVL